MSTNTDPPPGGKQDSDIWIHGDPEEGLLNLTNAHKHNILNHDWLEDFVIDNSMTLLKRQFSSSISGLQSCLVVPYDPSSLDSPDSPFIQIINTDVPTDYDDRDPGSHWITLSNIETISKNDEDNGKCGVYDSLNRTTTKECILKIASDVVLGKSRSSDITFIYFRVQQQEDLKTCGLKAIANAVELAFKNSPQNMKYNVDRLGAHLVKCLETKKFSPFPLMCAPKTEVFLRDLNIEEVLLHNFGIKEMLTIIRSSLMGEKLQTMRESILFIISKMVMLDYNSRQLQLTFQCNESRNQSNNQENYISNDSDSDDEFESLMQGCSLGSEKENVTLLHPSDVITIIMNCCDNNVRQLLVQKMVMCQLAIPLVFPNFYSDKPLFILWAMRLMNMNLKSQLKETSDMNQVDYPAPIISAVRLGDLTISKSEILNKILCNQKPSTFFHKNCELGNYSRKMSEGLIELAWYLPGGRKEDTFDNIVSIANLRGDAKHHSKQFEFVCKVSSVVVIFYSIQSLIDPESCLMLKKLSSLNQPLVFIFLDDMSQKNVIEIKELMGNKTFKSVIRCVNGQLKNEAMLTIEIIKKINVSLKKCQKQELLNWDKISDIAGHLGIEIDKDNECCKKGKDLADTIMKEIESIDATNIKNDALPLQGEPWAEWSSWSKKQARLDGVKGEDPENFISKCIQLKENCLEKQCYLIENMNPVMSGFIQILTNTKGNPNTRINFVQWMKFYLDIMETQNKLEKLEINLVSASFRLEHFLRELGQVYEAIMKSKKDTSSKFISFINLPQYAAELLISGIPLEIMDGDVGHLPLIWVSAVFDSLKFILGDKKVYVVSVLGVQSSGKSTLLNTMFGLNFAVSAGRCTKGVFAQLVPVDNCLNCELGYDYILVLDTEGLRAPERGESTLNHDNQLATMIIGLGDVTIVNNMGENMAEIKDILEICVHAFLRMQLQNKSLKLQPSCYFIHQNVSAVNADKKMSDGNQIILDQLDRIAKAAAKQEGSKDIESFKDVIDFNVTENVWYFPSLWQGDPPMAPVNPNYCTKVLALKDHLLKYPSKKDRNCLTLSDLQLRMSDIWNALLYENFVFSFKNSREVKAYKDLEVKYSSVSWEFRNEVKKWTYSSVNKILSSEDTKEVSLQNSINNSLDKYIDENLSKYSEDLDLFITLSEDKDILVKWKGEIEIRFKRLSAELKYETKHTFISHFEIRRAQLVTENQVELYKKRLHVDVKEFVKEFDNIHGKEELKKMSVESLKKVFAKKWTEWIQMLSFNKIQEKDIIADVINVLTDTFKANRQLLVMVLPHNDLLESELHDLDILPNIDYKIVIQGNQIPLNEIQTFSSTMLSEMKNHVNRNKHQDYDKSLIVDICKMVYDNVFFSNTKNIFELQINFLVKITVYILRNVIPLLRNKHRQFLNANDPACFLEENVKPQLEHYFLGTVSQCMQEKTAADTLNFYLEKAIVMKVKRELPLNIADNIRCTKKEFHTKTSLYFKVLEDLGNEKSFDKYIQFIRKPNTAMSSWLKDYVSEYCTVSKTNGKSNLGNEANVILSNTIKALTKSVRDVNASVGNNNINFKEWLIKYQNIVNETVSLENTIFDSFELEEVKDKDYFEEQIILGFGKLPKHIEKVFSNWSVAALTNLDEKPYELLSVSVLGCTEQCPFCLVICTATIAGHEGKHHNSHHRPKGMGGRYDTATQTLVLPSCHVDVAGAGTFSCRDLKCCSKTGGAWHPYADYGSAGPRYAAWDIKPDTSLQGGAYWRWVFVTFGEQFEKHYSNTKTRTTGKIVPRKCPPFPPSWRSITWTEAAASIKQSI